MKAAALVGLAASTADQLGGWLQGRAAIPAVGAVLAELAVVFAAVFVAALPMLIGALVVLKAAKAERTDLWIQSLATGAGVLLWSAGTAQFPQVGLSMVDALGWALAAIPSAIVVFFMFGSNDRGRHNHGLFQRIHRSAPYVAPSCVVAVVLSAALFGRPAGGIAHPLAHGDPGVPSAGLALMATLLMVPGLALGLSALRMDRRTQGTSLWVFCLVICVGGWFAAHQSISSLTRQAEWRQEQQAQCSDDALPNIVLIVVDTLRADFVSTPGRPGQVLTPEISALANESLVFANAVAPSPWTLPSMASIMTGLAPRHHGLTTVDSRLPVDRQTLAEALKAGGYRTAAIGHQTFLANPTHGFWRGFDDFNFYPKQYVRQPFPGASTGAKILRRFLIPQPADASAVADLAEAWLSQEPNCPFFLWLHFFDPHALYEPPERFVGADIPVEFTRSFVRRYKRPTLGLTIERPSAHQVEYLKELYGAEVRHVDQSIGRVVAALKRAGVYDDSLVVLTSDHGEQFFEHGLSHHGASLYQEELHVPLIVKRPRAGITTVVGTRVSVTSVFSTILDSAGIGDLGQALAAGSLPTVPVLEGKRGDTTVAFGHKIYGAPEAGVYFGNHKYIVAKGGDRERLFDLVSDPFEKASIEALHPGLVAVARGHLSELMGAEWFGRGVGIGDGNRGGRVVDEETRERLRAIGYY